MLTIIRVIYINTVLSIVDHWLLFLERSLQQCDGQPLNYFTMKSSSVMDKGLDKNRTESSSNYTEKEYSANIINELFAFQISNYNLQPYIMIQLSEQLFQDLNPQVCLRVELVDGLNKMVLPHGLKENFILPVRSNTKQ